SNLQYDPTSDQLFAATLGRGVWSLSNVRPSVGAPAATLSESYGVAVAGPGGFNLQGDTFNQPAVPAQAVFSFNGSRFYSSPTSSPRPARPTTPTRRRSSSARARRSRSESARP